MSERINVNGRTQVDVRSKVDQALDGRKGTVILLPPKLTGRRTWEAIVHARRAS